jgi:phosphatidylserine decarboxylase
MKKTEIIVSEGYPFVFVTGIIFIVSLIFRFDVIWQIGYFYFLLL